jgi:hypothetical protein
MRSREQVVEGDSERVDEILGLRRLLVEMAALPSLVQLQKKGNKRPASKDELRRARKRALKCKTAYEARAKAKEAWQMMEKREVIQVFLDREATLSNPQSPVSKPLFLDKKSIRWSQVGTGERKQAIRWIAANRTEQQLKDKLKRAKQLYKKKKTPDTEGRVKVYEAAMAEWKHNYKQWKKTANRTDFRFGR